VHTEPAKKKHNSDAEAVRAATLVARDFNPNDVLVWRESKGTWSQRPLMTTEDQATFSDAAARMKSMFKTWDAYCKVGGNLPLGHAGHDPHTIGLGATLGQAAKGLMKQVMFERSEPSYDSETSWPGAPTGFYFASDESAPVAFKAKQLETVTAVILTGAGGEFTNLGGVWKNEPPCDSKKRALDQIGEMATELGVAKGSSGVNADFRLRLLAEANKRHSSSKRAKYDAEQTDVEWGIQFDA
jgi:hypothetical protein